MGEELSNLLPWLPGVIRNKTYADRFFGRILAERKPAEGLSGRAVSESGLTRSDVLDTLHKIKDCSSILELRAEYADNQDGEKVQKIRLHNANFCEKYLVCPSCAARVQRMRRARFRDPIKSAAASYPYAYMITFTVRDEVSLRPMLAKLKRSIRSFVRMGQKRVSRRYLDDGTISLTIERGRGEFGKVRAGFLGYEIKRGEGSGLWHAHAHGLFFCEEKLDFVVYDQEKKKRLESQYGRGCVPKDVLTEAALAVRPMVSPSGDVTMVPVSAVSGQWLAATGGESANIRVDQLSSMPEIRPWFDEKRKKRILRLRREAVAGNLSREDSIYRQSVEVLKYITIHDERHVEDVVEMIEELHNGRFFSTYGDFRCVGGSDFVNQTTEDSKEIWSLTWTGDGYGCLRPKKMPVFDSSPSEKKRRYLGLQAKALGVYRQIRKALIAAATAKRDLRGLDGELDREKLRFRSEVTGLWRGFFEFKHEPLPETFRQYVFRNDLPAEQLSLSLT